MLNRLSKGNHSILYHVICLSFISVCMKSCFKHFSNSSNLSHLTLFTKYKYCMTTMSTIFYSLKSYPRRIKYCYITNITYSSFSGWSSKNVGKNYYWLSPLLLGASRNIFFLGLYIAIIAL